MTCAHSLSIYVHIQQECIPVHGSPSPFRAEIGRFHQADMEVCCWAPPSATNERCEIYTMNLHII